MGIAKTIRDRLLRDRHGPLEEAYAREATSLVDLEMRDREIARGRFDRRR